MRDVALAEREAEVVAPSAAVSLGLLADFNLHNLAVLLQKNSPRGEVTCVQAPFGQTIAVLLDPSADFWASRHDALVLWTLPERAVPAFGKVLAFEPYSPADLLSEVDVFAELVHRIPPTVHTIFIPSWVAPGVDRGWGPLDLTSGVGVANALMRMNLRLVDRLSNDRRVVVLDANRWLGVAGDGAYSPTLWYRSKTPFHAAVFQDASRDILATLDGIRGRSKKIIIVDLDDTLWGGTVGEVGWEQLRLGGHDPVGEAFVDFQKSLKRLTNRGVVLALVSKNEESVALEAIRRHPDMVLEADDFAGWRINWHDKAANIVDLLTELNLGLESAVFLDDSPFERARVAEALPQILVPEMPADPTQYPVFLARLRCFDTPSISQEDRNRTRMYVADRGRLALGKEITSLDQWLQMLELGISVERLSPSNLQRAAQLFNKTNQMTLSTRRLTAAELLAWSEIPGHTLWTFRISDKFGDYGLCGIASLVQGGARAQLIDFLLSCRVMGRGVEEAMLATVTRHARDSGGEVVVADYIPSSRNQPLGKWLQSLSHVARDEHRFVFSLGHPCEFPPHIRMTFC